VKNILAVFGAGLLNLGGVIPALLSCSGKRIVVVTESKKLEYKARDVYINNEKRYKLLPITKELLSQLDTLDPNIVLYCERSNPIYYTIIDSIDIALCACRDGLKNYAEDFEEYIKNTREFNVISLDNNNAFIKNAAACSVYSNINYIHAVVHGAVVSMSIENNKIEICAGNPAEITLPPSINAEKMMLKKSAPHYLWQPKQPSIKIARNDAEFQLIKEDKRTSINSQHSIQVIAALSKGISLGDSIDEVQENPFSHYMDFDEMISISQKTHLVAYAYMIKNLQELDGYKELSDDLLNYDIHFKSMFYFLKYTYNSGDSIKRGINIHRKTDAKYKYESHIGALREALMYYDSDENINHAIEILSNSGLEISSNDFQKALCECKRIIIAADNLFGNL